MAEIYIFSNLCAEKFLERYMEVLGDEEAYVEVEGAYEYENVVFYDLCDSLSVMEGDGDEYSEEVIGRLAENDTMIYTYLNEDTLDGTVLAFEKGKIIRKFVECYEIPKLNCNTGELPDYEKENGRITSWIDVGMYTEYMFETYGEDETD